MSQELEQFSDEKESEELSAPSGKVVYKAILKEGEEELGRSSPALFWSGLAAGLSMGFSMIAEGLLMSRLPDTPWRPLVAKFGYSRWVLDRCPRTSAVIYGKHFDADPSAATKKTQRDCR